MSLTQNTLNGLELGTWTNPVHSFVHSACAIYFATICLPFICSVVVIVVVIGVKNFGQFLFIYDRVSECVSFRKSVSPTNLLVGLGGWLVEGELRIFSVRDYVTGRGVRTVSSYVSVCFHATH